MKQGKTLQELAAEVQRQSEAKRDFTADTRQLKVIPADGDFEEWKAGPALEVNGMGRFPIRDTAHSNVSAKMQIPKRYYDRMLQEAPNLLALNVNHWFDNQPKKTLVRTLDGHARALLSNRYRVLDNDEVLEAALISLQGMKTKVEVRSCEVTEKHLYLKINFPEVTAEIRERGRKKGDIVEAGCMIKNSEVGLSILKVLPFINRLVCLNGSIMTDYGLKKRHVGRVAGSGDEAEEFFKDDTLKADDEAFLLKLRDTVAAAADEALFKSQVKKIEAATENELEGDIPETVEVIRKKYHMTDGEKSGILEHLIKGGDLSQWGMANAITRTSQDVSDYDRATELEAVGGQVIELSRREWRVLNVEKKAA